MYLDERGLGFEMGLFRGLFVGLTPVAGCVLTRQAKVAGAS